MTLRKPNKSYDFSNSSFITRKNQGSTETNNKVTPKGGQSADSFKPHYLNSKHSIVTNNPENLVGPENNGFELKFPDVASFVQQPKTNKNSDVKNMNYIKFEDNTSAQGKILPSIQTKKSLSNKKKRAQNNRDLSMTVIKSGRLALQDESIHHKELEKNFSMSRESSKTNGRLQFPMSRKEAAILLENYLWENEQLEILDYEKIYFFNVADRKAKKIRQPGTEFNNGYDNENGDYLYQLNDHFAYRYELIKNLGKGSFGSVIKAFDHLKKEFVALKILRNRKKLHKQGVIEVNLIQTLNDADPDDKKNIVKLRDSFKFRNHVCITFEMLSINLYDFIKNNDFRGVSLRLTKRFAIQILVALLFMSEHKVIHCDMKPENILLRNINKSGIKIIDFGSGCLENERVYTYIQSRFYRAPEIILGIPYTCAIDMWSFGCILFELYTGYPLFAGENEQEQLQCIMEVKGVPPKSLLVEASRTRVFFDEEYNPNLCENSAGKVRIPDTKDLYKLFSCDDSEFVDFIDRCCEWKVKDRLSPSAALHHPWIKKGIREIARSISKKE